MKIYCPLKNFFTVSVVAISSVMANAVNIDDIKGPWHGDLVVGSYTLPLVMNFIDKNGAPSATLDSPLQGARDIPAQLAISGDTITVNVSMLGVNYKALYKSTSIEGEFTQNGMSLKLDLTPGAYVPPRPQTPQPPFPYRIREVTFVNPVDSAVLSGTITMPLTYDVPGFSQFPAVVMASGSGLQNRDEEIAGEHKPFAVIADAFAHSDIITLRFDDRGCGASQGNVADATTATFASDVAAAIDFLRENEKSTGNIGVVGHSEGGTIALMLAADGKADFAISLSGVALRGDSILIDQNRKMLAPVMGDATADEYAKALAMLYDYMRQNPQAKEWPGIDDATAQFEHLTPELVKNLAEIISSRTPWLDYFISYDPAEAIRKINVPVMALGGSLDVQVDSKANLGVLNRLLPDSYRNYVSEIPGLNHLLQTAKTGMPDEYASIDETISPDVISTMCSWINMYMRFKFKR